MSLARGLVAVAAMTVVGAIVAIGLGLGIGRTPAEAPRLEGMTAGIDEADSPPEGQVARELARVAEPLVAEAPRLAGIGAETELVSDAAEDELSLSAEILIEGTVVLQREGAEAARGESGTIALRVFPRGGERRDLVLPIVDGRFTALVPRDSDLHVPRMDLAGVPVEPVSLTRFFPPPLDGVLEIVARGMRTLRIHVVAAATGEALHDVTIVRTWRSSSGPDDAHPGPFGSDDLVVEGASSPVVAPVLEEFSSFAGFAVRAAGYGWARVSPREVGAETTVALHRSADLVVHVDNLEPHPESLDAVTRTFWERHPTRVPFGQPILLVERLALGEEGRGSNSGGEILRAIPDPEMPTRFEGITPGRVAVRAILKSGTGTTTDLAREEVTLVAGEVAEVNVRLGSTPLVPAQRVPLSGTLETGSDWDPPAMGIAFRPREVPWLAKDDVTYVRADGLEPVAGFDGLFRFDAGLVLPGTYAVDVGWIAEFTTVEVGEEGCTGLLLRLPRPADVSLRVVESGSLRAIESASLRVTPVFDDGRSGAPTVLGAATDGRYRFQCLPGTIRIESTVRGLALDSVEGLVEIVSGQNEITVEARVDCGITLAVFASDRSRGIDPRSRIPFSITLQLETGADPPVVVDSAEAIVAVRLDAPGLYVGNVAPIDGYDPVPPFTVDVAAGSWTIHEISLTRKKE